MNLHTKIVLLIAGITVSFSPLQATTTQDTLWNKDFWDSTEVVVDKSGGEWAVLILQGDTVGLELSGIQETIFLTKERFPVDFEEQSIRINYRISFSFHYHNAHATVNVVFDPPQITDEWWLDPIKDVLCGQFNPPVTANYLCNFGPYFGLGGVAGIDDNPQGEHLIHDSDPYPKNGEWLDVRIDMSQYQIVTTAIGDSGYSRVESTYCDLSDVQYITPAFGDQQATLTLVDRITILGTRWQGIIIEPDQADSVLPDSTIDYSLWVINNTDYSDVINILPFGTGPGWQRVVCDSTGIDTLIDTNGDGVPDTDSIVPGDSISIIVKITPSSNALYGDRDTTIIRGCLAGDTTIRDSAVLITMVERVVLVDIEPDTSDSTHHGEDVKYYLWTKNEGNSIDCIDITAESNWHVRLLDCTGADTLTDTDNNGRQDVGSILPGDARSLFVSITPPLNALIGEVDTTTVYAKSSLDTTVTDSVLLITKIYGDIGPSPYSQLNLIWRVI